MKRLLQTLAHDPLRYAPWLYLAACLLAYAPLIPWLGFYWDDWPIILFIHNKQWGQLLTHFSYDRPFSPWPFFIVGQLGIQPLLWHFSMLLLRWLGVVSMAWALKPLWPKNPLFILYTALLFAIYPGYHVQPVPVTFATQLSTQLAFFVSLGAMGRALTTPRHAWRYGVLSILAAIVHMFTMEYFIGLEALRPVFLWLILRRELPRLTLWQTIKRILVLWTPYLLMLLSWAAWRFWLLELPSEPYPLDISSGRVQWLIRLLSVMWSDFWHGLLTVWQNTLQASFWPAWLAAVIAALAFSWLLVRSAEKSEQTETVAPRHEAVWIGLVAFFASLVPIWTTGNIISEGEYNNRYLMAGLLGLSLLVSWLLTQVVRSARGRAIVMVILLTLAVGNHVRNAEIYRQDWSAQRNFFWQMVWRAPNIAAGTAIITPDRITFETGEPLLGAALNALYPIRSQPPVADLWNLELRYSHTLDPILRGETFDINYRGHIFRSQSPDSVLMVRMAPEGGCLWTLSTYDAFNPYISEEERQVATYSNHTRILAQGVQPDPKIFGAEPERGWCYYYQQAQLANQFGDPAAAILALTTAESRGLQPALSIEWLPLVQAHLMLAEWDLAAEASQQALADGPAAGAMLCAMWGDWQAQAPGDIYAAITQAYCMQ